MVAYRCRPRNLKPNLSNDEQKMWWGLSSPAVVGCGYVMQDGHSLANEVSLEKLFQYANTHSSHQASVGGTTSFISSFYSDFAFITLSKQINQNGIQISHRREHLSLITESVGKLDEISS